MNKLKMVGVSLVAAGGMTKEDWLLILSILITGLGMLQEYLKNRKEG